MVCTLVLPCIVRLFLVKTEYGTYPWFPSLSEWGDLFLYGKRAVFFAVCILALLLLADAAIIRRKRFEISKSWLLLAGYGVFALFSAVFSRYRQISFGGGIEQFESVYVLLGYGILCFYSFYLVRTGQKYQVLLTTAAAGALLPGMIGVLQFAGFDLLGTELMKSLIVPGALSAYKESLSFLSSSENRVYMTLYNSNYVGTYVCLLFPICIGVAHNAGQKWVRAMSTVAAAFLAICLIGSRSRAGMVSLAAAFLIILPYVKIQKGRHRAWFLMAATAGMALAACILGFATKKEINPRLTEMSVAKDGVHMVYEDYELYIGYSQAEEGIVPVFRDKTGAQPMCEFDVDNEVYVIIDERLENIQIGAYLEEDIPYIVVYDGDYQWVFADMDGDGTLCYMTAYGKEDEIVKAETALPEAFDGLFTYRGYIWSRTLPLLKKHLLLGSGPDTFAVVFPQNDYVRRSAAERGFFTEILTKPHSMYLQWALQTGVLSFVCVMLFLCGVLRIGFRALSETGGLDKQPAQIDEAAYIKYLLISVLAYLFVGICNDSCIATAPVFWMAVGMLAGRG